jgi:hypothetical protein
MSPNNEITSSEIDAKINEFETKLDRLYRQYEQYFIGVENRPPRHPRRQVARMYRELEQLPMIKTSLKFRFRSLVQRFNSYKTYWNRTERQIEEGTYHRDVARARARIERREESDEAQQADEGQPDSSGRSDDGAFELDELDLDLGSMEEELQQMDKRGEFEKYVGTKKVKHDGFPEDQKPAQPRNKQARQDQDSNSWQRPEIDENVKQKRLAELQAKLGLSSKSSNDAGPPAPPDGTQNPFDRSSEGPTQKARPENPSAPSRGADVSKLRKLRRAKERLEREKSSGRSAKKRRSSSNTKSGSNRVIRRNSNASNASNASNSSGSSSASSDDHSRKIYDNLVEAKRRCKEDTSNLNYDKFKQTMDRQRSQIQKKKGGRDVDFKVVIKEGRAFLKPETKD